jgi:DNA-directed RNA polymerase
MSAACLREAFVSMYEGQNHLEALRTSLAASVKDATKLPPVPPTGTLDLEQVRHADYFFA